MSASIDPGGQEAHGDKRGCSELSEDELYPNDAKRRRTLAEPGAYDRRRLEIGPPRKLEHVDYTVGWICALPIELAASQAMLDCTHESLPTKENDDNTYTLGNIGKHNIVMACLPLGQYGTNNAAIVASNMHRSFPFIRIRLMVGIGGGVPSKVDIRLGDIVVGNKVIQYDMGKILSGGRIQRTGTLKEPPPIILKAIAQLQAHYERIASEVPSILGNMIERYPRLSSYAYPQSLEDRLFRPTYEHDQQPDCRQCNLSELQNRPLRSSQDPKVHYGGIASGNQVVKSAKDRDALAKELDIICFEMEAAGLMDIFPCLVIRGICDYADSHKNKQWQPYAAATAAAFAKEFLSIITPNAIDLSPVAMQDKRTASTPIPTPQTNVESSQIFRADFLELLRFDQLDSRHATIKAAHRQTCAWLLKHASYKLWLDPTEAPQHHGFLWISGKPGAGKSTLMKFAFSNVRRRPDANTAYTSFFFNARGDELEKSTAGLHRSLLLQVLERFPDLQSVLDDPLLVPRNQTSCPNNEVLRDLFRDAVMNLGQRRLICFVDALDECDEEQVREMVTYFEDLADEATTGGIQLQICFSSRHYPHIEIQNGLKFTLEDQPGHEQDLEKYVRNCLRVGKRSDAEEIKAGILEKANGVFMWVVLVVDILNKEYGRGRISAARKKLSEIPSRLSDLFKDILRRDNENMDDLLLCIQWILYAKRPLTREEFYFAMLSGMPSEDLATYDPERITSEDLDLFVISSSKGLAEITKSKNATIQFIHESVRDFLIKDNGLQSLWPQLGGQFQNLSHDKLKECCHSYMNFATLNARTAQNSEALPKANSNEAKELRRKTLADFPFLDYATEYVLHHGDLGAIAVSQLGFLDQFPLQAWIQFTNILEKHEVRRYTPTADLTYILAERNLVRLLEARMETNPHVHVAGERYGFPMLAALANGHLLAAKTLLGQAAGSQNIEDLFTSLDNMKSWSFRRRQGPLHWAIENRQEALAVSLIDSNNIDLSMKDAKRRTALHWAAIFGDESTMKFLLEKMFGPHGQNNVIETMSQPQVAQRSSVAASKAHAERTENINALDHNKKSPLSLAAENGHEAIVRMLLMWGASINTSHTTDSTGLYSAAYSGHTDIVKLLIENGAAVDYIDYNGRTALYAAARSGHTDIVKLLIKNGAAVDHTDSDRWMALHAAARSGHTDIVKLLIKNGAPVDYTDHNSRTPLDTAAGSGHTEIVKLLIENGAAVGHTGHYGRTALHAAAGSGHTDIVKLLIKNGAPVDYTDHNSRTPLDTAAGSGHTDIVKLLIENGAAVGRTGHYGNMALHDAARDGHTDIVKLLIIKNRAAVGHTYHNGKTALHAAARSGHTDTVKLLIENGAAVNHTGHYGNMALHDAARDGHTAVVKILLASGAQIFINKKGWRGRTALHQAVQHGHIATITTLLNNGATIDSTNDCGETPLSTATSFRHDAVVALLKSKAVDASLSAVGAGS